MILIAQSQKPAETLLDRKLNAFSSCNVLKETKSF